MKAKAQKRKKSKKKRLGASLLKVDQLEGRMAPLLAAAEDGDGPEGPPSG